MKAAIIIPSRYASKRLPAKALADIAGKPLVVWVYQACKKVRNAESVIVATDHEMIKKAAKDFGAEVYMTSPEHQSGTDRCAEVAEKLDVEFIINVQGDEPFIDPMQLEKLIKHLIDHPNIEICTLFHQLPKEEVDDHSKVKLVKTLNDKILYFSRSAIPHDKDDVGPSIYKHVGIYAFRKSTLLEISQLSVSTLEQSEGLEQLRWLENGYDIYGLEINASTMGIDTPEDLIRARNFVKNHY
ncbi:3-deoxy-manno-octulosonate cytidylyltransferase [Portibacter marinus]|uniref:3-deoxy-manno-octulosonate cytidylyltransferase n=1 Tax=Portibacter marinus TaxID=2898660 RepID=UPI001F28B70C|nr:3-deoxy-manno-octulosonate cytidylyltransferase [Portibacter marinus]